MILQSPESAMPEPYRTYIQQRSEAIAEVLEPVVKGRNVQLCPRAILPEERIFNDDAIVYGAVVKDLADGYKSILYPSQAYCTQTEGIATSNRKDAIESVESILRAGNNVRIKDPLESDSQGQYKVSSVAEAQEAIEEISGDKQNIGFVIMPNFEMISHRISVGRIMLNGVGTFNYVGHESTVTKDGSEVYGGTLIGLQKGADILDRMRLEHELEIPPQLALVGRRALDQYEKIAVHAGRVSVDVIEGKTENGAVMQGVVDLTPRVGGATPAEVLAIRETSQRTAAYCIASSRLLFDPKESPKTGENFVDTSSLVINADVHKVETVQYW